MPQETQDTEALRAMITLRQCWFNHEEIYIHQGCLHCGSAATYLLYFTNRDIQKQMLDFIGRYNCHHSKHLDLLDFSHFQHDYELFLSQLEQSVIHYAFAHQQPHQLAFEQVESIFEREFHRACA